MPEGPTIVVFKKKLEKFSGKTVTESGGYNNPYQDQISGKKLISLGTFGKYLLLDFGDFLKFTSTVKTFFGKDKQAVPTQLHKAFDLKTYIYNKY